MTLAEIEKGIFEIERRFSSPAWMAAAPFEVIREAEACLVTLKSKLELHRNTITIHASDTSGTTSVTDP